MKSIFLFFAIGVFGMLASVHASDLDSTEIAKFLSITERKDMRYGADG